MKIKHDLAITNGKYVFNMAWQRCQVHRCIPLYSNLPSEKRKIRKFYVEAQLMNLQHRGKFEVDHILPLNHPLICGLHVESNLQVISKTKNTNKGNDFIPYCEINGRKVYFKNTLPKFIHAKIRKKRNPTKKNPLKLAQKRLKTVKKRLKPVKTLSKSVKNGLALL